MHGHNNRRVFIRNGLLIQTGTYQEQSIRPFETHIRKEDIDALATATEGGTHVGVSAVQSVANSVIRPSAVPESKVPINHGWLSRRFRFYLVVEEHDPFNTAEKTIRVFYGYTDHSDASFNHIDPETRFYFNSEVIVRESIRPTPNGLQKKAMVTGSNQIISPLDMAASAQQGFHDNTLYMIRPEDVFNYSQSVAVADTISQYGGYGRVDATLDGRSMVGGGGGYKYSNRRDTIPSRYLSDTLTAYNHAVRENEMRDRDLEGETGREVILGEARKYSSSQNIGSNTFFSMLKDHADYMGRGYVTLRDLNQIFPETLQSNVIQYTLDDGRSIRQVYHAQDSEHWQGSDDMTLAATTLAQVVPSIMMDNFIRSISFAATNGNGFDTYAIDIHPQNLKGVVDGVDMLRYVQEFERRLVFDVLSNITHRNQVGFQISMSCDLAGDSIIDIALDVEPHRKYIAPTFTDSLFTPVVTRDSQRQHTIASDIIYLVEQTIPTQQAIYSAPVMPTQVVSNNNLLNHPQDNNDDYSGLL